MTDDQYIQDLEDEILISVISEENLDKLAEESMKIIMECDPKDAKFTEIAKYKCEINNEYFDNFIYLNGGWVYFEQCPLCGMIKKSDASNHKEFLDNHKEV